MTTLLYTHSACQEHDTGFGHRNARLTDRHPQRTRHRPVRWRWSGVTCPRPRARATHPYPQPKSRRACSRSDSQTEALRHRWGYRCIATLGSCPRAAGSASARRWMPCCDRKPINAFCAIRPPGHHAEPAQAMGFARSTTPPSVPPTPAPFTIWNGGGDRFRRAPWQRHLRRSSRTPATRTSPPHQAYIYPAPAAAKNAGRQYRQRPAAGREWFDLRHAWHHQGHRARATTSFQLVIDPDFGWLRRPLPGPAGRTQFQRGRLRVADPRDSGRG